MGWNILGFLRSAIVMGLVMLPMLVLKKRRKFGFPRNKLKLRLLNLLWLCRALRGLIKLSEDLWVLLILQVLWKLSKTWEVFGYQTLLVGLVWWKMKRIRLLLELPQLSLIYLRRLWVIEIREMGKWKLQGSSLREASLPLIRDEVPYMEHNGLK